MTGSKTVKRFEQPTGSPSTGEPVFLVVGKLRRPHGLHGAILMDMLTDFPERLIPGKIVYLGIEFNPIIIGSIRNHGRSFLVNFENLTKREDVDSLRNQYVHVRTEDCPPLPEGEYYHHQLIGLSVIDEQGNALGTFNAILETGANDVYIIRPQEGPDILLPAIESVIQKIDLIDHVMYVNVPPGLIPE